MSRNRILSGMITLSMAFAAANVVGQSNDNSSSTSQSSPGSARDSLAKPSIQGATSRNWSWGSWWNNLKEGMNEDFNSRRPSAVCAVRGYTTIDGEKQLRQGTFICAYTVFDSSRKFSLNPGSVKAAGIVHEISATMGIQDMPMVMSGNIDNAMACIFNGKRALIYSPEFIATMQKGGPDKWVVYSILSHELGHHFNGHTSMGSDNLWMQELQADYYAGFVTAKKGATLAEAEEALKQCEKMNPRLAQTGTPTHPPIADRLKETEKGWKEGIAALEKDVKSPAGAAHYAPVLQQQNMVPKSDADKGFDDLHQRVKESKPDSLK